MFMVVNIKVKLSRSGHREPTNREKIHLDSWESYRRDYIYSYSAYSPRHVLLLFFLGGGGGGVGLKSRARGCKFF